MRITDDDKPAYKVQYVKITNKLPFGHNYEIIHEVKSNKLQYVIKHWDKEVS